MNPFLIHKNHSSLKNLNKCDRKLVQKSFKTFWASSLLKSFWSKLIAILKLSRNSAWNLSLKPLSCWNPFAVLNQDHQEFHFHKGFRTTINWNKAQRLKENPNLRMFQFRQVAPNVTLSLFPLPSTRKHHQLIYQLTKGNPFFSFQILIQNLIMSKRDWIKWFVFVNMELFSIKETLTAMEANLSSSRLLWIQ